MRLELRINVLKQRTQSAGKVVAKNSPIKYREPQTRILPFGPFTAVNIASEAELAVVLSKPTALATAASVAGW